MRLLEIVDFVKMALECSLIAAPKAPGLTDQELVEIGKRLGYQAGEVLDATPAAVSPVGTTDGRYWPPPNPMLGLFFERQDPDYRDVRAFDFVFVALRDLSRTLGMAQAKMSREVLVERAVQQGLQRSAVEAAVSVLVFAGIFHESGGEVIFAPTAQLARSASEQLAEVGGRPVTNPLRAKVHPIVVDVVQRRQDGRKSAAEPLDAFGESLDSLGYGPFRLWWTQTVNELRLCEVAHMRTSTAVLAAALVEGALTFVVRHARSLGLGAFGSTDFEGPASRWKIDELVKSAARGGANAVLSESLRARASDLVLLRQRIHAGRMLVDHPQGVPDLRPEEARDARATAEAVVRGVLDWLDRYPPST